MAWIVGRICEIPDINWDFEYQSMLPWLDELDRLSSSIYSHVAEQIPALHETIIGLVKNFDLDVAEDQMRISPPPPVAKPGPATAVEENWSKTSDPVRIFPRCPFLLC